MNKYRILALDGGGIRGALTVNLLARLKNKYPPLICNTDLLAGTSTGGFIALGLADQQPIKRLLDLYTVKNLQSVFNPDYINLIRPRYDRAGLKTVLQTVFPPQKKLQQLSKQVVVPALRVVGPKNWQTVFFNNFKNSSTRKKSILEVALATSAAPTYFPSYQQYIDGGLAANNPSLAALSLAKNKLSLPLSKIRLFSIGTGLKPNKIDNSNDWGILQWAVNPNPPPQFPLLNLFTEGNKETTAQISQYLLENHSYRLNPPLPCCISLDEYEKIPDLIKLAHSCNLQPAINWLQNNW